MVARDYLERSLNIGTLYRIERLLNIQRCTRNDGVGCHPELEERDLGGLCVVSRRKGLPCRIYALKRTIHASNE